MLDPNYMLHISEPAEDIAEQLHNSIIKRIIDRMMLRIGRGEDYLLTATDKWQIETLQEAGILLEDIQAEIARKTRLQEQEIKEAMEEAGVKAIEYDDKIYESVGLSPKPLEQSPNLIRIMQRNYIATMGLLNNFTRTIAEESQKAFISAMDIAYNHVITGSLSYTEVVKEAVSSVVSTGVEVVWQRLDENGQPYVYHRDTIETATLRCVRTGVSQASSQIGLARMDEMGVDKVLISSHLGARPTHQVWQGKVFTKEQLRSTDEGMPAYGTVTGLCGANCRHNISPYIEGMSNPFEHFNSKENLDMYEKEQRQRLLERRIRDTKREVLGLKESMDKCQDEFTKSELERMYMRKSALLSKQNQAYTDYCESNGMKKLNDRISIARWDRKQAAAARGAAQRWNKEHGGSVVKEKIIKTDIDDYLDFRKKYESSVLKLKQLENENDALFDAFNMATDAEEELRLEKIWESKFEEFNKFEETVKDLKSTLLGKETKAVRQLEKKLSDKTGMSIDKVKMLGMPYDCAKTIYDGYDKIINLYPELKGNLIGFEFTNDFSSGAYASCRILTGEIKGHGIFRNFENLVKEYAEDVAKGYHPIGTDYRSVIVHELGHALDGYMTKKRLLGADFNQYGTIATSSKATKEMTLKMLGFDRQEMAYELKAQGLKTFERRDILDQREKEFIIQNVSEYASENEREFFAECFAEYLMSDNPRKASKIFGEIINTALGR